MSPEIFRMMVIVNTCATWWMTGLVWFVGIVHYPLFSHVGSEGFVRYHAEHVRRTQTVVIVPMFLELIFTIGIAAVTPRGDSGAFLAWTGVAFVASVWVCTFFRQVPDHHRLSKGFEPGIHRSLLSGNTIRSLLWSGHAMVTALQCMMMP